MSKSRRRVVTSGPVQTGLIARFEPYLWLLPMFILLIAFCYYPFAKTIQGSLFKVNMANEFTHFIGLDNYEAVVISRYFKTAILNTLKFVAISVPGTMLLSLTMALMADKKRRFHGVYSVLFSIPMAVSMSATCLIFKYFLNNTIGLFNYVFNLKIDWFNDKTFALPALTFLSIWINSGYQYIFITAALRNVPGELLEASCIEGAGWFQRVRKIILPLISPTLFYLFCISLVQDLMTFAQVNIITQGGPRNSTTTLMYLMYRTAFYNQQWGQAYALSIIIFILTSIFMALTFAYEKKGVFYS